MGKNEGHDARLLRFSPSEDGTIIGNLDAWVSLKLVLLLVLKHLNNVWNLEMYLLLKTGPKLLKLVLLKPSLLLWDAKLTVHQLLRCWLPVRCQLRLNLITLVRVLVLLEHNQILVFVPLR